MCEMCEMCVQMCVADHRHITINNSNISNSNISNSNNSILHVSVEDLLPISGPSGQLSRYDDPLVHDHEVGGTHHDRMDVEEACVETAHNEHCR